MSNAWFLTGTELRRRATFEWLGDAFIAMRSELDGEPAWDLVIGRNDPHDAFVLLYHDERGTGRVFDLRFEGGRWEAVRADPDFHQRIVGDVRRRPHRARAEASETAARRGARTSI
jgi:hypothetical protein